MRGAFRIAALLTGLAATAAVAQTVSSTNGTDSSGNVKVVGAGVSQGAALSGVTGSLVLSNTDNLAAAPHICGSHVTKHITTATDTQLVASSGSQTIYVCDYEFSFNGTGNAFLEKSTSGTCATPTQIAQAWYGVANMSKAAANPYYRGLNTGASAQLCVNTSAAVSLDVTVYYDQY